MLYEQGFKEKLHVSNSVSVIVAYYCRDQYPCTVHDDNNKDRYN